MRRLGGADVRLDQWPAARCGDTWQGWDVTYYNFSNILRAGLGPGRLEGKTTGVGLSFGMLRLETVSRVVCCSILVA